MKNLLLLLSCLLLSCNSQTEKSKVNTTNILAVSEEVVSLLGTTLLPMTQSASTKVRNDSLLAVAQANFDQDPSEENFIWLGRRQAYRGAYTTAIGTFTKGLQKFPDSYRLLRHRGHRYITVRKFDQAIVDFEKASELFPAKAIEIEPDGMPNAQNIPLSNTAFNIYYHLGLAYYLNHDFKSAIKAYEACLDYCNNSDLLVATADWLYMTFRRTGNDQKAKDLLMSIPESPTIIENDAYFQRIQLYRGQLLPAALLGELTGNEQDLLKITTQGYGVGNYYLYQGDSIQAKATFERMLLSPYWSAFGYIATF